MPESDGLGEQEFREIYARHAADILQYAIRCVGRRGIAEELTSEAFLRLYRHKERVDAGMAGAWLSTTVKNLARDYWRRSQVEQRHLEAVKRVEEAVAQPEELESVLAHPALGPEHRICLTLRYVHGMERKQISEHTGLTDNQVKSCLQYGLKLLRQALGRTEQR